MTNLALQIHEGLEIMNPEYRKRIHGDDIIEQYLKSLNTEATRKTYARSIREFFNTLYPNEILTLDMMIIDPAIANRYSEIWKEKKEQGDIKASTYNGKIKGIKAFYEWLRKKTRSNIHQYELLPFNPFDGVKQVAENDAEGSDALSPDDIMLMLTNPYGHNSHTKTRNILMFVIAITTGIRNSALINIKEENIKVVEGNYVIDAIDKEGKRAIMPINNYYHKLMTWYENDKKWRSDGDTIFNIHPSHASLVIKEWAKSVGIDKNITFHSLRATTAVRIYEDSDGNLAKVQTALHHSHSETSLIYTKKASKVNHDAENIIENILHIGKFDDMVNNMDKEQLVKLICALDVNTKMQIMRSL